MGKIEVNLGFQSCGNPPKRILICGLGSIGRKHARILHQDFPGIELSVWRSGNGPECPELSLMTHQFSESNAAILWKPDAAIICSPAPFHQQQALSLARQQIPLLIEKPLGCGIEPQNGWDELLQYSQAVPISIGYVLRHDPCAEHIKTMLDNQVLGKLLEADFYCGSWLPDWRPGSDYRSCVSGQKFMGGGALLELSHEIDLALWLFNFEVAFASLAKSGLIEVDVEDQVLLAGRSSSCASITIRLNMCTRPARRDLVIRCEKGEVNWDLLKGRVDIEFVDQERQIFNPSFSPDDRFRLQAARFLKSVDDKVPPYCSLKDGLEVLRVIKQAHIQARSQSVNQGVLS